MNCIYQNHKDSIGVQERFLVTSPLESDTHDYKWWVPITFAAAGDNFNETFPKVWMKENEKEKDVKELPNEDEAVIFNVQQTGKIYRFMCWPEHIVSLNVYYYPCFECDKFQDIIESTMMRRIGD